MAKLKLAYIFCLCTALGSLCEDLHAQSRPFDNFNFRNFRMSLAVQTARPASMGGAAIASTGDPVTGVINPASLTAITRPVFTSSHRMTISQIEEPSYNCNNAGRRTTEDDFLIDLSHAANVYPYKYLRMSAFRELVANDRYTFRSYRPFDTGGTPEALLRSNAPSRRTNARLSIVDNGGAIGIRMSRKISIGALLRITRFDYELQEGRFFASEYHNETVGCVRSELVAENLYLNQTIDERAWGLGFGLGATFLVNDELTLGLIFHNRPSFKLKSRIYQPLYEVRQISGQDTSLTVLGARDDTATVANFNIPDNLGLGFHYKVSSSLKVAADVVFIEYRNLISGDANLDLEQDNSPTDPDGLPDLELSSGIHIKDWQLHFRAGIEFILSLREKRWRIPLRVGYAYEPAHVLHAANENESLRQSFPRELTKHHITAGSGFFLGKRLRLDGALNVARNFVELSSSAVFIL
ncbi:MAG: OmpP1/FadL family transporter [Calditrichia bacterium]